jgi:hypothetical protein
VVNNGNPGLIASEQRIGLDKWQKSLLEVIRTYAGHHGVPVAGLSKDED